ncbi:hypothetical protein [Nostoc sp.]|uniref:hypothetical protein n=1 Tax=Nostoc sp. TaxID=1180 RepID=UPI002FF7A45E
MRSHYLSIKRSPTSTILQYPNQKAQNLLNWWQWIISQVNRHRRGRGEGGFLAERDRLQRSSVENHLQLYSE